MLPVLTCISSLEAIAQTFSSAEGPLRVCDTLNDGFKSHSLADKNRAFASVREQEDILVSDSRDVRREDAAPLVAKVCDRETPEWLLEKYSHLQNGLICAS